MSEVSILVQPFQHIKTQSDTFFWFMFIIAGYVSLGLFRAINPVNMSFLSPAVLSSKCGKKAHINVYETFCLFVLVQFTSGVFVKERSWMLSGLRFCSTDDVAISSVGYKLYLHHRVCAIFFAFLASQKSFGAVGKFMQSEAWPSLQKHVAVLQLTAVLFWCVSLFLTVCLSIPVRTIGYFLSGFLI